MKPGTRVRVKTTAAIVGLTVPADSVGVITAVISDRWGLVEVRLDGRNGHDAYTCFAESELEPLS